MFWIRLRSSILIVIVAVLVLWPGGAVTAAGIGLVSLIGLYELNRIEGVEKKLPGVLSYICSIAFYLLLYFFPALGGLA